MRQRLDDLLRDVTLVTLALALALGWSLYQVAQGVGNLVRTVLVHYPAESGVNDGSDALTWVVDGRVLTLGELVQGLVELAVVLLVALLIQRRARHSN